MNIAIYQFIAGCEFRLTQLTQLTQLTSSRDVWQSLIRRSCGRTTVFNGFQRFNMVNALNALSMAHENHQSSVYQWPSHNLYTWKTGNPTRIQVSFQRSISGSTRHPRHVSLSLICSPGSVGKSETMGFTMGFYPVWYRGFLTKCHITSSKSWILN